MTTTKTMSGLGSDEKPTSRVLRPPGGGSSDIFGTGSVPEPAGQNRRQNRTDSNIFGTEETQKQSNVNLPRELVASAEEHKIYGKGRNQSRGRFNPITGEPYDENGSPAAATPEANPPQRQQQQQQQAESASPVVGASSPAVAQGQGDSDLQAAPGKARPEVHTSSRVINPPGGRATKLW